MCSLGMTFAVSFIMDWFVWLLVNCKVYVNENACVIFIHFFIIIYSPYLPHLIIATIKQAFVLYLMHRLIVYKSIFIIFTILCINS